MDWTAAPEVTPEHLALLDQVIRDIARRRLSPDDAQDFAQSVHVRLLERNYDIFTRFEGRSSLKTYLGVVVTRQLLDWQNSAYGKWRPSAAAARLGGHAVTLERLISRDGFSTEEAVQILGSRTGAPAPSTLRDLAGRLPRRCRPRLVSDELIVETAGQEFNDPVDAVEQRNVQCQIRRKLAMALRLLPAEDQTLVRARYYRSLPMRELGPVLNAEPKRLYRRLERALKQLRTTLVEHGVVDPEHLDAMNQVRLSSGTTRTKAMHSVG